MALAPTLEEVLANVCRGRTAPLCLTKDEKKELRDPEGQIALDVLRHLLGARPMNPERFPLAEQAFQAVARKLGYAVGQKRCRRMIKRLRAVGVIAGAGQYRQPYRNSSTRSGFCVTLYKLARRLRGCPLFKRKRPVGNRKAVKADSRSRWWAHPLFGDILALPPPGYTRPQARRMASLDELFQSPR